MERRLQTQGVSEHSSSIFDQLAVLKLPPNQNLNAVLEGLRKTPDILYVEPNYRFHITRDDSFKTLPNDFDFAKLWGMQNSGQTEGTAGADIDATEAWRVETGSRGVIVAVIDTGID